MSLLFHLWDQDFNVWAWNIPEHQVSSVGRPPETEAHASLPVRCGSSNSASPHCLRSPSRKEALLPAPCGAASGSGAQADPDPLASPARVEDDPFCIMGSCQHVKRRSPSARLSELSCSESLVKTHPSWVRRGTWRWGQALMLRQAPTDEGGPSHSQQPGGSQALLAKPLKKRHHP